MHISPIGELSETEEINSVYSTLNVTLPVFRGRWESNALQRFATKSEEPGVSFVLSYLIRQLS
jgi:hypothetical protein